MQQDLLGIVTILQVAVVLVDFGALVEAKEAVGATTAPVRFVAALI